MAGNSIGTIFKVTTWGESHGAALGVVIDGCPPNIPISETDIQKEVDRRKPKDPRISTTRKEEDKIRILSGVFEGKTTGAPISIIVFNKEANPKDYEKFKNAYRPGHADFTYSLKYGIQNTTGGSRSSGRETISRVMAGAVAKKMLESLKESKNIAIYGHVVQVGDIKSKSFYELEPKKRTKIPLEIEKNKIRCADKIIAEKMIELVEKVKKEGDSIGAIIEIVIENPPSGLGEPVFDKLDADLAKAFMSIGAVKGVEFGNGFASASLKGSENNDQMRASAKTPSTETNSSKTTSITFSAAKETNQKTKPLTPTFLSNNAGGILGGISNGNTIIARLAIKPTPSIAKLQKTITTSGENTEIEVMGRHDTCLAPRIIPVAESMAAIVVLDHLLMNKQLNPNK
jgi:chorismate synthase